LVSIGYTIMGEQAGPKQLVADAIRAEEVGFDFIAASDHYFPWLDEQGHSPYTWSVLGAVAQATEKVELMTYVTCPTMRYHPAVVAQKAATIQLLTDGRFTLGVGAGENLNEHVAGGAWPPVDIRHDMLDEALQIIRRLFAGETVTFRGAHLSTENAKLWDLPPEPPRIGVAASGPESCALAGRHGDALIAVQPDAELGRRFDDGGGAGKPRIGQVAVSYDTDESRPSNEHSNSSGGSLAAGTSWPSFLDPITSRPRPRPSPKKTSPSKCRVEPTSNRTSTPCASSPMLASPTSPSCKSVATCKRRSSTGPNASCFPTCAASPEPRR